MTKLRYTSAPARLLVIVAVIPVDVSVPSLILFIRVNVAGITDVDDDAVAVVEEAVVAEIEVELNINGIDSITIHNTSCSIPSSSYNSISFGPCNEVFISSPVEVVDV